MSLNKIIFKSFVLNPERWHIPREKFYSNLMEVLVGFQKLPNIFNASSLLNIHIAN